MDGRQVVRRLGQHDFRPAASLSHVPIVLPLVVTWLSVLIFLNFRLTYRPQCLQQLHAKNWSVTTVEQLKLNPRCDMVRGDRCRANARYEHDCLLT